MKDYTYLTKLIQDVNLLRKQTKYHKIDIANCNFSYMATKKTSFVGYKQGYSDIFHRNQKGVKESDKLRSTTKNYLKFIRNKKGELLQIDSYVDGSIDCIFQEHWIENVRYLFPFSEDGGFYPTYAYVAKFECNRVTEEYMVSGTQIIYESYSYKSEEDLEYAYINYVPEGKFPILAEEKGVFHLNPLTYEEHYSDNWLNHFNK